MSLVKATLTELDASFKKPKDKGKSFVVQFNPESLKVTFANAIEPPKGGDQAAGAGGQQFVGAGSTKLALQLWFDVNAMEKPMDDVRRITKNVIYFMTPQKASDPKKKVPPGVRFQFGTFIFDGIVEALEETIDFFSPDGKALRSAISLTFTKQEILETGPEGQNTAESRPGIKPLASAKQGDSVQNMAGKNGKDDWQSIAAGNGIEDPMRMSPGALVDLDASAGFGGGASFGASIGGSFDAGASASLDGGIGASLEADASFGVSGPNASLGGSASASLSIG
jgi:hypothetical protein